MEYSEKVKEYIGKTRRYNRNDKLVTVATFGLGALALVGGLAGVIVSVVNDDYTYFSLFAVIAFVVPIALFIGYIIWEWVLGSKSHDKFIQSLKDSGLSAEELLQVGKATKTDLFSLALYIRCVEELNMDGVPEWCARDGVMPELPKTSSEN